MNDVLYIQTDKNVKVTKERIYLQDIADLSCGNPSVLNRCKVIPVRQLTRGKYGRYAGTVLELIRAVQRAEPNLEVIPVGEPEFILTYAKPEKRETLQEWCKTAGICMIVFFGTMFSIMTFQTDVDVNGLFQKIYQQFTGRYSDGFTVLEITYSVGIGIGVILFFNHFGKWKLNQDPTPMEVEMRSYEDQVDMTVLEMKNREES